MVMLGMDMEQVMVMVLGMVDMLVMVQDTLSINFRVRGSLCYTLSKCNVSKIYFSSDPGPGLL